MRASDPPKLFVVACLALICGAMMCAAVLLIGYAAVRGAMPMVWLWILAFAGVLVLRRAYWLLRRLRDPRAWQRPQHTPASLALWTLGVCVALLALLLGGDSRGGSVGVLVAGSLIVLSGFFMRKP